MIFSFTPDYPVNPRQTRETFPLDYWVPLGLPYQPMNKKRNSRDIDHEGLGLIRSLVEIAVEHRRQGKVWESKGWSDLSRDCATLTRAYLSSARIAGAYLRRDRLGREER